MLNDNNIYFLGYSGHAYVAMDVAKANGFFINGYFDKNENKNDPYNIKYIGNEEELDVRSIVKDAYVFPAVGSNIIRKKLHFLIKNLNVKQLVLKHPTACISSSATIGESSLINPNAVVNSFSLIGKACIINTGSIIEHECMIDDYSHIAPGAVLAGKVVVGKNCFVGANAVIKQGVNITDEVIIGAGSVILNNITEKGTWVGNPAKLLLK
ncbi:acetyltransferase [Maribacter cobaltidurans]|uniref:Acetyltransferase n=1 Tax=Maribacter cobaltidurans TaxID=1178778 RepID=A0A223V457_9FLAO|nr:acetyltransferase [Maribacter cobaltidurans]ASV30194.1 acetyltransferase [Maribacter cobaltidurans]GGD76523.1 UDP-N-acetylbacillosamine N-acetyltransferase [Maribacter cobaltidurans]